MAHGKPQSSDPACIDFFTKYQEVVQSDDTEQGKRRRIADLVSKDLWCQASCLDVCRRYYPNDPEHLQIFVLAALEEWILREGTKILQWEGWPGYFLSTFRGIAIRLRNRWRESQPQPIPTGQSSRVPQPTAAVERKELLLQLSKVLSEREYQVIQLVLANESDADIARRLSMKENTVRQTRRRAIAKMRERHEALQNAENE